MVVDIWVEGIADQKFLSDILKAWFGHVLNKKFELRDNSGAAIIRVREANGIGTFTSPEGWTRLKPFFEENDQRGAKNLVIVDADDDFEKRKNELKGIISDVIFDADNDVFLWPNHQSHNEKGDLEKLLEQIIHPNHQVIFNCWDDYENCLRSYPQKYTTPARKTKIYAYLEALLGETQSEKEKIKERERDYTDTAHWNLDHTKEPLKPLYEFLKRHLNP